MRPIIEQADTHLNRLMRSVQRLKEINDTLFGSQPPQTESKLDGGVPYSMMSELNGLASSTNLGLDALGQELERLEDGLYLNQPKAQAGNLDMPGKTSAFDRGGLR